MQMQEATITTPHQPPPRPGRAPWQIAVEDALAHAFRVALPRANSCVSSRLGFSAPSYSRSFSHGYETLFDIAKDCCPASKDLGAYFDDLLKDRTGTPGSWDRLAGEMREERALELVEHVLRLAQPQREVVVLRSSGMEWKRLVKALPGRAYFSIVEDYEAALRSIWARADDLVSQTAH